jgi:hypothetical protein
MIYFLPLYLPLFTLFLSFRTLLDFLSSQLCFFPFIFDSLLPSKMAYLKRLRILFERRLLRIVVQLPAVRADDIRGFPEYIKVNARFLLPN